MSTMTVCAGAAQLGSAMLKIHLLVALIAFAQGLFDRFVWVVAAFAWHRGVHGEAHVAFGLERPVAARAVPSTEHVLLCAKDVASGAIHRHAIEIDVRQCSLLFVACRAHPGVWGFEGLEIRVVAIVASDLVVEYVQRMTLREPHLWPAFGYLARGGCLPLIANHGDVTGESRKQDSADERRYCDRCNPQYRARHGAPKWQSRQGKSFLMSSRLEKPGGWGLPPGPPTT